eukprot:1150667-Pelagomonas_calceolata.AAC.4
MVALVWLRRVSCGAEQEGHIALCRALCILPRLIEVVRENSQKRCCEVEGGGDAQGAFIVRRSCCCEVEGRAGAWGGKGRLWQSAGCFREGDRKDYAIQHWLHASRKGSQDGRQKPRVPVQCRIIPSKSAHLHDDTWCSVCVPVQCRIAAVPAQRRIAARRHLVQCMCLYYLCKSATSKSAHQHDDIWCSVCACTTCAKVLQATVLTCMTTSGTVRGSEWWPQFLSSSSFGAPIWVQAHRARSTGLQGAMYKVGRCTSGWMPQSS